MDEHFLHYIWKHQKFTSKALTLTNGQPLAVFSQGFHNHDSGPDFEEGRVKIGEIEWAGSIEIHIRSSDWLKHFHEKDQAYNNVILHVVWSHDKEIYIEGNSLPTLELKNVVDLSILDKCQQHTTSSEKIACASQIKNAPQITYTSMLDRVAVERLEIKGDSILETLGIQSGDWESTTYQTLAHNFGFSTNKLAFDKLVHRLPFDVLKKNLREQKKTEALIFGQAGFLNEPAEEYQKALKEEFDFLRSKFKLSDPVHQSEWKLGRMRPANFPTVRLAQFATLLHRNPGLFSSIVAIENPKEIIQALTIKHTTYWQSHYDFGKQRKKPSEGPGTISLHNLIINSVAPILAAYSKYVGELLYMDRAIALLEAIKPEENRHTKEWNRLNMRGQSAFQSQAQIQLLTNYCEKRKCLDCNIGVYLLGK